MYDSNANALDLGNQANNFDGPVARYMRNHRWCVYYDNGSAFLHGPNNPPNAGCGEIDPAVEGHYNQWPELAHITLGRNHRECSPGPSCSETVCYDYARWYQPHPAGYFESMESWNGVALRLPNWPGPPGGDPGDGWQQGSVLHWIAAGGSFALGRVNGTTVGRATFVLPNLYEHGLTWGESIWTAIEYRNQINGDNFYTPIGDPLARVTVYDPDADGNGVIDVMDVQIVMAGRYDVNKDGVVDEADLQLVLDVYGRSAWDMPEIPGQNVLVASDMPASPCGDVNRDGAVNAADLALIDGGMNNVDCPGLDINQNGVVDLDDRNTVLYHMNIVPSGSWCIGDINFDGVVDNNDIDLILAYLQANNGVIHPDDPNWNPIYNIDCNAPIGRFDYLKMLSLVGTACPPSN